jgi:dienelactone hydrolase
MRRVFVPALICLAVASPVRSEVRAGPVEYRAGDTVLQGYLAYDDSVQGSRPAVLVVHEWWGHNEHARDRARALARLGYTALAVDMYGDGKTAAHPEDAGKFAGAVRKDLETARARFVAGVDLLRQQATVDPERVGAIGYCFGGAIVLEMARQGVDLDGVASFHGSLGTGQPARSGEVRAKVLVLNGADDPMVSREQVAAFQQEMEQAKVDYRFVDYPGAKHSFTNPDADAIARKFNLPLAYNAEVDRASWAEMERFFQGVFTK